jgi:3-oxoacyl-[acyl-carrier-protein] synthase III
MPHSHLNPLTGRPITITGLGMYVPDRVVTNDDLSLTLDTSDEWIRQRTGIRERRVVAPGVYTSDLATSAGRDALADAGAKPEDIDLVIVATLTPDNFTPATAARVAANLGCVNAGAFDLSSACAGFIYGLAMAAGSIVAGIHKHVLLVGAEIFSRILDPEDRGTAILFGDGAGAAVVEAIPGAGDRVCAPEEGSAGSAGSDRFGVLGFDLGCDGSRADVLGIPGGGSRMPPTIETVQARQHYLKMDGKEVYKFATRVVGYSANKVLSSCGYEVADVDLYVPHQANLRIIESGAEKMGFPNEKIFTNLQKYGNTSAASVPLCLYEARAEGRLKDGDLVLLMGFGAGLSWASCLIRWGMGGCDRRSDSPGPGE